VEGASHAASMGAKVMLATRSIVSRSTFDELAFVVMECGRRREFVILHGLIGNKRTPLTHVPGNHMQLSRQASLSDNDVSRSTEAI
jgi:hypothetical protein